MNYPDSDNLSEEDILNRRMELYYMYSEQSENREQLVRDTTIELNQINPRWDEKMVNSWFINNKINLKPTPVFDPNQIQASPISIDKMPLKKRHVIPPRPASVGPISCISHYVPTPEYPTNDHLESIFSSFTDQQVLMPESQKILESRITNKLFEITSKLWYENIATIEQRPGLSITDPSSISPIQMKEPDTLQAELKLVYNSLETGIALPGGAAACVDFNSDEQCRYFRFCDKQLPLNLRYRASSIMYDVASNTFFIISGTRLTRINANEMAIISSNKINNCSTMLRSSLCALNESIAIGMKQNIGIISRETLNSKVANGEEIILSASAQTSLPSISSIASVSNNIAVASNNHHSIHLFNNSLQDIQSFIGHGAGVTCLSQFAENQFISGSADFTARLWDIRSITPCLQMQRHYGPISTVSCAQSETNLNPVIITGGYDHTVRVWDLRAMRVMQKVQTGAGIPISADYSIFGRSLTIITKEFDSSPSYGFCTTREDELATHIVETSPNLCICYHI